MLILVVFSLLSDEMHVERSTLHIDGHAAGIMKCFSMIAYSWWWIATGRSARASSGAIRLLRK